METLNRKFWWVGLAALLLSACNDSDDKNADTAGGEFQQFSTHVGDSKEIMAPDALQRDLSQLFGLADAEPVSVNANDSVQVIIDRANSN